MKAMVWVRSNLLILFGLALSTWVFQGCSSGSGYEDESKAYMDQVAPVVFKDWDTKLILAEADPDLKNFATQNQDSFNQGIESFKSAVGSMKAYKGATLLGKPQENPDKTVTATYSVEADFDKGTSKIIVITTRRDGKWQLGMFNLDPQAELDRVTKALTPNP